jgi:hypothetical protein
LGDTIAMLLGRLRLDVDPHHDPLETDLGQASDREDAAAANQELSPADFSPHPFAEDFRRPTWRHADDGPGVPCMPRACSILDFFKVPAQEKSEVMAAFAAHKGEVTEGSLIERAG